MGVVVRLIRRMNDALGLTSVVVTHDVDEVSSIADCTYLLSGGQGGRLGHAGRTCGTITRRRSCSS
jgi:phospholipid/cholesterol/gamma-HCH transport system ATP-binding protein